MAETKITGIRADAETTAKFKELSEQFPNSGECLKALINAHEMAQAKQVLTGQETSIADFQALADSIVKAYIASLELSANAETRIRQEFQQMLDSKDSIILSLQESLKQAETAAQAADERATAAEMNAQAEYEQQGAIIADLQTRLETANQKAAEQAEAIKAGKGTITDKERIIISLQEELHTAKIAADSIPELTTRATTAENSLAAAQREIESLNQRLADEKAAAEQATALAAERAEVALQKAVLTEQKAAAESAKAAVEETKNLYAEISKLKDEIRELKESHSKKPDKK